MPLSQTIHALPSDVIAKIKSSTSIVHLTGVILELVKNALDANAHIIFITVDFKRGGCIVEDDGDGIPPIEFESIGGLGKPHRMHSKSDTLPHLLILGQIHPNSSKMTCMATMACSWHPWPPCLCSPYRPIVLVMSVQTQLSFITQSQ
jgi:hypothetical protein